MRMRSRLLLLAALMVPGMLWAEAWLGDHGHYLRFGQDVWLHNPTGRAFTLTVVRDVSLPPYSGEVGVNVKAPDGETVLTSTVQPGQGPQVLEVPAAGSGVYHLWTEAGGLYYFLRSDLPGMVIHAGDPTAEGAVGRSWFHLMNMLPRRWWFFVPAGTESFEIGIRHRSGTSGREDLGLVVYSPRGQRVRAWRGSPGLEIRQGSEETVSIPVEPSMDGRFWSMTISNGDSHWHSDNELVLRGVPPYLAQAPEQWFDAAAGQAAAIALPWHEANLAPNRFAHHMPNTWLGDQSYSGLMGAQRIELLNPAAGRLVIGIGTYALSTEAWQVGLTLQGPDGAAIDRLTIAQSGEEWQKSEHRLEVEAAPAGRLTMEAVGNRYFAWTDPALPMVVTPAAAEGPINLEVSGPRHWYFQVPAGTERFPIRVYFR